MGGGQQLRDMPHLLPDTARSRIISNLGCCLLRRNYRYVDVFDLDEPSDDASIVLPAVAKRMGSILPGMPCAYNLNVV